MSNQLQITGGAKVRNLEGVLTGTSGVVSSLGINVPDGIPQLDGSGKILVSQLPNSVMEYKGTWNAATNTPTLADGTGNAGDVYLCNVAGTVNFGSGPITFYVGDQALYSGTIWQRASGASGTVTSVSLTESGDSLTITGSPITTSGTINIGFAGNSGQYINGEGNLTTFPSIITQAQNLVTEVYNETGATLTKGTVVYINGGHGNLPTITKALATSDATSAQTYGVVRADISNNNNGYVTVIGNLDNMDTQAYAAGTQLYLSSTTAGAYTSTKQYAPAHLVYVGIVTRSHPTQGVIEVKIQNGFEMDELHNVSAQTPSNNDGLFYTTSTSLWETKSIATALGYTPANDSQVVHLAGTETITGAKTFSTNIIASNGLIIGANPTETGAYSTGNIGIGGQVNGSTTNLLFTTGASYGTRFYFNNADNYNYTFPSITGTVALLEGTQTFSGAKTFSSTINADGALVLKNGVFSIASGYTTLAGNNLANGLTVQFYGSGGTAITNNLNFNSTTGYTYTFPASSGTLALTSSLSSYVPYSGATSSVDLGSYGLTAVGVSANSLYATGVSTQGGYIYLKQGSSPYAGLLGSNGISADGTKYLLIANVDASNNKRALLELGSLTNNTSRTYTLPDASGTLALTSDLSNYVTLTGASQTITSAKTFTSFPTTFKDVIIDGSGTSASGVNLKIATGGIVSAGSGYTLIYSSAAKKITIYDTASNTNGVLDFSSITTNVTRTYSYPDANGTLMLGTGTTNYLPKFTGASTIGNSLIYDDGTNVGIGTNAPFSGIAYAQGLQVKSASNNAFVRVNSGSYTGVDLLQQTDGNAAVWNRDNGYLQFGTNNTARMTITAAGNVGIGTTPTQLLTLGGTASPQMSIVSSTTTGSSEIYFGDSAAVFRGLINYDHSSDGMIFYTAATEAMRLTSDNHLTLKATTAGGTNLDMYLIENDGLYINSNEGATGRAIYFQTGGTTRATLTSVGDLGIGLSPSNGKLEVLRTTDGSIAFLSNSFSTFTGNAVTIDTSRSATSAFNMIWAQANNAAQFYVTGAGVIYAKNATVQVISSDYNLKTDIKDYDKGLSEVLAMKPRYFKYKDDLDNELAGFIAQEMGQAIDGSLIENKEGNMSYQIDWYPLLVKAIQELSAKVSALENK